MTDRLSELVRQRALVIEHLAWLDREIAHANAPLSGVVPPVAPVPAPIPGPLPVPKLPDPVIIGDGATIPASAAEITAVTPGQVAPPVNEELLKQYRVSPKAVHQNVRKGCLLYFIAAFVVLGVVVAILYFTISSR